VDLSEVATLSKALALLLTAPKTVRDLEADLWRLSGRLAHLFTVNYERASEQRAEIHAVLDETRDLLRTIPKEIMALQAAIAEPRAEIAGILRHVAAELERVRA
jgi:hypothetical protein